MPLNKSCEGLIDLHTHSTASDGSFSPKELVRMAKDKGLKALAITDHDTVEGLPEAVEEADRLGLQFVPGVEISCDLAETALHILGYWIDYRHRGLTRVLTDLVDYRTRRNHLIIDRFRALGIDLDYEEIAASAGNDVVGRPHFALALVKKGEVADTQEAFERYLARGKPAYVNKRRLTADQGIELITKAGGLPALAHPCQYGFRDENELREALKQLVDSGLQGLEVWYPTHSPRQSQLYLKLAREYKLAPTGGSDFHGESKPEIKLGTGVDGELCVEYEVLENLRRVHRKQ